jgi:hypothetical protein
VGRENEEYSKKVLKEKNTKLLGKEKCQKSVTSG